MWKCCKCAERLEDDFDVCWSCGTTKEGVLDAHFLDPEVAVLAENDALKEIAADGEEEPEIMRTVAQCDLAEAYAMRWKLEAEGIHVVLGDEITMGSIRPYATAGIKVQVPAHDAERAMEIVEDVSRSPDEKETDENEPEE